MTEQAAQEPTMEEILASIRRIISEDEPAAGAEAAEAEPAVALVQPEPEPEDVLELTERAPDPEPVETHGDLDILPAAEPEPAPVAAAPAPVAFTPAPAPVEEEALVSAPTAEATSTAFGNLSRSIRMPTDGATLEGVVRELLRPLLQAWLDENLPGIVQNAVAEEVERLSRRRV
jgi:uncharacterized protein